MLWWVPLESLEERYSKQWAKWMPEEFRRQGIQFRTIEGESLCDTVEVGTFLDINSTMAHKASQIQTIAGLFHRKEVKPGDKFFLADTEMFGMEGTIRYLADLNKVNVKIYGFAHAGSYTREDFVEPCAPYAMKYESAWDRIFDKIFVGSQYHANQLQHLRAIYFDKTVVTGNPYDVDAVRASIPRQEKVNRVIHTNRPDPEKRPDVTLDVFERLKVKHPDWEFMVTTSRKQWSSGVLRQRALRLQEQGVVTVCEGLTKDQYLTLLAQSKVMTGNTIEENFGYALLEALIFDTIPIVPNDYSHPELLENNWRCLFGQPRKIHSPVTPVVHQDQAIESAMDNPFPVSHYADKYQNSLAKIVSHLV